MEGRGEKLEGIVPAVGSAGWVRRETGFIRVFRVNGAFQARVVASEWFFPKSTCHLHRV